MEKMNIGYFADGPWAHQALQKILNDSTMTVAFVCARADNPDPILSSMAINNQIDFLVEPNINSELFVDKVARYRCDVFVSMSFNQIFKQCLFSLPPLRTVNCHAGKLPSYRGRNILNWALINDETEFGITVHYVDEGIDTGDILDQQCYKITDEDTYATLLERAYVGCSEVLYRALKGMKNGRLNGAQQSQVGLGFYCTARIVGDEILSWRQSSRDVFNFVRALCKPGPQARAFLRGVEVSINRVEMISDAPVYKGIPGAVVGLGDGFFIVKTEDSFVRVTEWSGVDRIKIGDRFE
jgi:methionyl-tRNA formyltransferase